MDDKAATAIADLLRPSAASLPATPARARPCYLILVRGGSPGAMLRLLEGANRLGREAGNDWPLSEPGVSRRHAMVRVELDSAWLTDQASTNGTFVNGRRAEPHEPTPIRDGDRIQFGAHVLVKFVRPDACDERFHREMYHRTVCDTLTGLYNRAHFLDQAGPLGERLAARGLGLAVLMLDVDRFKRINDTHGHDVGDRVLREVAGVLRNSTRSDDLVAAYGGEEFVAAVPATTVEPARQRAERIREALECGEFEAGDRSIRVTASIGLSFAPADRRRSVASQLTEADQYLYHAKRSGRNRVVSATPPAGSTDEYAVVTRQTHARRGI